MDRNRIHYVAQLPHGEKLVTQALAANEYTPENLIKIDQLADRFGVQIMLSEPKDNTFLASQLYYFSIDRSYADLSLIMRPDTRKYKLLDHLLEFKHLKWSDKAENAARSLSRDEPIAARCC